MTCVGENSSIKCTYTSMEHCNSVFADIVSADGKLRCMRSYWKLYDIDMLINQGIIYYLYSDETIVAVMINASKPLSEYDMPLPVFVRGMTKVSGFNGIVARYCELKDQVHELNGKITLWGSNKSKYILTGDNATPVVVKDGWYDSGSDRYYIENGDCKRGWLYTDSWYYFDNKTCKLEHGLKCLNKGVFYFDLETGKAHQGWLKNGDKTFYFGERYSDDKPAMKIGWSCIDDIWYYFNETGTMVRDKVVNGYYLNKRGKLIMQ